MCIITEKYYACTHLAVNDRYECEEYEKTGLCDHETYEPVEHLDEECDDCVFESLRKGADAEEEEIRQAKVEAEQEADRAAKEAAYPEGEEDDYCSGCGSTRCSTGSGSSCPGSITTQEAHDYYRKR